MSSTWRTNNTHIYIYMMHFAMHIRLKVQGRMRKSLQTQMFTSIFHIHTKICVYRCGAA